MSNTDYKTVIFPHESECNILSFFFSFVKMYVIYMTSINIIELGLQLELK